MTVVQPNSISGINSITVQSGQSLSVHQSDGTLIREIVSATGVGTFYAIAVGTAATISANGNATFSGIVTATSFVGDGSGLTGAGPSLTGSTNNTIVTVTGSNAIAGEANLTYDGTNLDLVTDANNEGIRAISNGNSYPVFELDSDRGSAGNTIGKLVSKWNNTAVASIQFSTGGDTTNKDDAHMLFNTASAGTPFERLRITSAGYVGINSIAPDRIFTIYDDATTRMNLKSLADSTVGIEFGDQADHNIGYIVYDNTNDSMSFGVNAGERANIGAAGTFIPGADNTQNLGSPTKRWANLYTGDLNLCNEGSYNEIDGTSGSWTMQEGESDLFLINRKSGKQYKFNLTEVN